MASHSLIPPQLPIKFDSTPENLAKEAKQLIKDVQQVVNEIVIQTSPENATYASVIQKFALMENRFFQQSRIIKFYASTHPNPQLRQASTSATTLLNAAQIDMYLRHDFFERVAAVFSRESSLQQDRAHYLEKFYQEFVLRGAAIAPGDKRDRFNAIQKEIDELTTQIRDNINGQTTGMWLAKEDLSGLPADFIARCPVREQEAAQDADKELDVTTRLWIRMKNPDTLPISKFAKKPDTRKKVHIADQNRCPENIPLFTKVLALRRDGAHLLGFPSHAELRIKHKMVGSAEYISNFLDGLRKYSQKMRNQEIENLKSFKMRDLAMTGDLSTEAEALYEWDFPYYDRLMKEKEHSIDQREISEYFELEHTLAKMFCIYEHIFGVQVTPVTPEVHWTWHESVKMYSVWDIDKETPEFLGFLYLDLFPRDGKYTHAGHYGLSPGFEDEFGKRHYPSSALVLNLPQPTVASPCLLLQEKLRQVFHELGHGMHSLLSKTIYGRFHGTNADTDFIEIPGKLFEHILWTPSVLRQLSCHYSHLSPTYMATWRTENSTKYAAEKPRKLSQETIDTILEARHVNMTLSHLSSLFIAVFDMAVHSRVENDLSAEELASLYAKMRKEVTGLAGLGSESYAFSTLRSIMGNYDAGYYTYMLARVFSIDLFNTGFGDDVMNPAWGRRFRYEVLQPGGSQSEWKTIINYLGRKPSAKAFYQKHGWNIEGHELI